MVDASEIVVPDCCEPDSRHDPSGTRPAVYWYVYRDPVTGLAGLMKVLCVECCARARAQAEPVPTRIGVLRDANTQEPVILRQMCKNYYI